MKQITYNINQYVKLAFICLFLVGCSDDFLTTGPSTQVSELDAFSTTNTADAVLKGAYRQFRSFGSGAGPSRMDMSGLHSVAICRDVMGPDQLVSKSWWNTEVSYSAFNPTADRPRYNWWLFYKVINNMNNILAKIDNVEGTQADKDKIRGEALALRGFSYFELVNTYAPTYSLGATRAGVPIYLKPTTAETAGNPRSSVGEVYTQLLSDLTTAKSLMTSSRTAKAYMNLNVINGILARVYLTMGNYAEALSSANAARQGYPLMTESEWKSGFKDISNPEWIWGQDNSALENPDWGSAVGQMDTKNGGNESSLKASNALVSLYSNTDVRKSVHFLDANGNWSSRKFQVGSPIYSVDYPYLRSAEMYLIEAEGLARTGNEAGAHTLLHEVQVARDPSAVASTTTGQALIDEIVNEKRKEFWGEGVLMRDMLRLSIPLTRDPLHNTVLNIPANSWLFIFPIPENEFLINRSLNMATDQNPLTGIID